MCLAVDLHVQRSSGGRHSGALGRKLHGHMASLWGHGGPLRSTICSSPRQEIGGTHPHSLRQ